MTVESTVHTVGTTAEEVTERAASAIWGYSVLVTNTGASTVYVGGPHVTTSDGYPVPAGGSVALDLEYGEGLWAVAATSSTVAVLQTALDDSELAPATWQLEWGGVPIGYPSPYQLVEITGLHDTPEVRTSDANRARRHGQYAGTDYLGGRSIQAAVEVVATHPNETTWSAFSAAMVPAQEDEAPLLVQIPGLAGGRLVRINARLRKLSMPVNQRYSYGFGEANVEWWATDPRIYDATETSLTTSIADVSGTGAEFPFTFPLSFGGAVSGGTVSAENVGEFRAPWQATITGPVTDPRIENVTTGQTVEFSGSLAAGESLVIDSDWRSVLLNGTASRYSWLRQGSEWFSIEPGVNTIRFAGVSGSGSMTLTYRSAWI